MSIYRTVRVIVQVLAVAIAATNCGPSTSTHEFLEGYSVNATVSEVADHRAGDRSFKNNLGMHKVNTEWWYYNLLLKDDAGQNHNLRIVTGNLVGPHKLTKWIRVRAYLVIYMDRKGKNYIQEIGFLPSLFKTGRSKKASSRDLDLEINLLAKKFSQKISGSYHHALEFQNKKKNFIQAFSLDVHTSKNIGDAGFVSLGDKSSGVLTVDGKSSNYFSAPKLKVSGKLKLKHLPKPLDIRGSGYFEHFYGSHHFTDYKWAWFQVTLQDGRDLIFYQLHKKNSPDLSSPMRTELVVIGKHGERAVFNEHNSSIKLKPLVSQNRYPTKWVLELEELGILVNVNATSEQQFVKVPFGLDNFSIKKFFEGDASFQVMKYNQKLPVAYGPIEVLNF